MKTLLLIVLAFSLSGCTVRTHSHRQSSAQSSSRSVAQHIRLPSSDEQLVFAYRVEGQHAVLDSEQLRLVFCDTSKGERNAFNADSITIQIAGEGVSETEVSCRRNLTLARFHSRYERGTNTINFCGHRVLLSNHAQSVTTKRGTLDLSGGKQDVLITSKGD